MLIEGVGFRASRGAGMTWRGVRLTAGAPLSATRAAHLGTTEAKARSACTICTTRLVVSAWSVAAKVGCNRNRVRLSLSSWIQMATCVCVAVEATEPMVVFVSRLFVYVETPVRESVRAQQWRQ